MCILMMRNEQSGLYLFSKPQAADTSLKEMLQFIRTANPGNSLQFAYVEADTSLLPNLTLWENLHVVAGGSNWKELFSHLEVDWQPLVKLIRDPDISAAQSSPWERLAISLIKASLIKSQHILVDINESIHSPLNLLHFKKMLLILSKEKNVYLASANASTWMELSHSLVSRNGYEFVIETVQHGKIKRDRTA